MAINLSNRPFFGAVEVGNGDGFKDITPDVGAPLPPDVFVPEASRTKHTVACRLCRLRRGAIGSFAGA